MSNVLVRGLPENIHRKIQKMAEAGNLSVNQVMVRLLAEAVEQEKEKKEDEGRHREAFRRLNELREEMYRKYGKQEDSTKIIREMREERTRRLMGE